MERSTKIIQLIRKFACIRSEFKRRFRNELKGDVIEITFLNDFDNMAFAQIVIDDLDDLIREYKINLDFEVVIFARCSLPVEMNLIWSIPRKRNQSFLFKHYGNNFYHSSITLQT